MPTFRDLSVHEKRSLIHLCQNKKRGSKTYGCEDTIIEKMSGTNEEERLAKISEDANYALKNRYRHQRQTMDFADNKRMPVDETKVRDLLRNQHLYREKMDQEVGTYSALQHNPQMQNGVLTYLNEAAHGEMKDLINEVGINTNSVEFFNLAALRKLKAKQLHTSDENFHYLMNAMFTPVDMTDYEDQFVGWNEVPGEVPISRLSWLNPVMPELHPQTDKLAAIESIENRPVHGTGPTF